MAPPVIAQLKNARNGDSFHQGMGKVMGLMRYFLPVAIAILAQIFALRSVPAHANLSQFPISQLLASSSGGPHLDFHGNGDGKPVPNPTKQRQHFAHAIIVRTSPEKGGVAPQNIGKVEVWYDAGIRSEYVALAVINAAGDRVDKHDAAIDLFDPAHVSTRVDTLAPGEYTVRYRALSADGHQVSGAWVFEVNEH